MESDKLTQSLYAICKGALCCGMFLFSNGCGRSDPTAEQLDVDSSARELPLTVFVSILPQKTFVEKIAGDKAEVYVMVGAGQNPHTYEPTPRQMMRMSRTQIYFRIGVPFEDVWIDRLARANPQLKVVDTRRDIQLREMARHRHAECDGDHAGHGHAENDSETQKDPHIWLNPRLVKKQAETICEALLEADVRHADEFRRNLHNFHAELDALDAEIREILAGVEGSQFMVFHPAWGYFADAYGLRQIPVELEGKEPSAQSLQEVMEIAREHEVHTVFVQKQFSRKTAEAIATAIGGKVQLLDPLAPDYFENMKRIAAAIAAGSAE